MKQLTQTIQNAVYGYNPQDFMPIRVDGQLANRADFYRYKVRCIFLKRSLV